MEALASGVPFFETTPRSAKNCASEIKECAPFAYSSNANFTIRASVMCGSILRFSGLFWYPKGASPNHSFRRNFWRIPRLIFSARSSEKYLDCPNATCNIKSPCGVGSNQNVGKRKDTTLRVSTEKKKRPPTLQFHPNLS